MTFNGTTSVTFSSTLVSGLTSLGVQVRGFGGTPITNGVARFSITGGSVDLNRTKLEIGHSGGLTFTAGRTEVSLTDFVITNLGNRTVLTGALIANGSILTRAPLFDLQVGSIGTSTRQRRPNLDIDNVQVTLSREAAAGLNQVFGVNAFTPGFSIGTAQVDALFDAATGNIGDRRLPVRDVLDPVPSLFPGGTQNVVPRGQTSVTLNRSVINALDSVDVTLTGFGGTRVRNGVADFLITGGATDLDATKVELFHAGGLTLQAANIEVNLTDFVVTNLDSQPVLTGTVIVNDRLLTRIPLFNLQIGGISTAPRGALTNLDLTNVALTLNVRGARTLNRVLGTNTFASEIAIGTAQVDAFVL